MRQAHSALLYYPGTTQRKMLPVGDGRPGGGQSGGFISLCPVMADNQMTASTKA